MRIELMTEISGKKIIGLTELKALADDGDDTALNLLGEWVMMGYESSPDERFAVRCFLDAARKMNTQAMINLGVCYMEGKGVTVNFEAAERWIRAADECGDPEAVDICETLYLSSIGNHKPDMRQFVDFLVQKLPLDDISMPEEEVKQQIMKRFVLEAAGFSESEIESNMDKVTDEDIHAYERTNDIYVNIEYAEAKQPLSPCERKVFCQQLISNANIHTRQEIAPYISILFHLSETSSCSNVVLHEMGEECGVSDVTEELTWVIRAVYELDASMYGSFHDNEITESISVLRKQLDAIEEQELHLLYQNAVSSDKQLIQLRDTIQTSRNYQTDIKNVWVLKIQERIIKIQETTVQRLYTEALVYYEKLYKLYTAVQTHKYETEIENNWLLRLHDSLCEVQEKELSLLCAYVEKRNVKELEQLRNQIRNIYTFDSMIQYKYLLMVEEQELERKYSESSQNINGLKALRRTVSEAGYNPESAHKWIAIISEQLLELEDEYICAEVNKRFQQYFDLIAFEKELTSNHFEQQMKEKWKPVIRDRILVLQEEALENLFDELENKEHTELLQIYQKIEEYSYSQQILQTYRYKISEKIDRVEIQTLECLCQDTDNLGSEKYTNILEQIADLPFRIKNTETYTDIITEKRKQAVLIEDCAEEKLENCDLDQLNERIRLVHFSKLNENIKENLNRRITYYSDLIYDGQDKASNVIREQCRPENLMNLTEDTYKELKEAVRQSRIQHKEKETLISQVEQEWKRLFIQSCCPEQLAGLSKEELRLKKSELKKYSLEDHETEEVIQNIETAIQNLEKKKLDDEFLAECLVDKDKVALEALKEKMQHSAVQEFEIQKYLNIIQAHLTLIKEEEEALENERNQYYKNIKVADIIKLNRYPFDILRGERYFNGSKEFNRIIKRSDFPFPYIQKPEENILFLSVEDKSYFCIAKDSMHICSPGNSRTIALNDIRSFQCQLVYLHIELKDGKNILIDIATSNYAMMLRDLFNEILDYLLKMKNEYLMQCDRVRKLYYNERLRHGTDTMTVIDGLQNFHESYLELQKQYETRIENLRPKNKKYDLCADNDLKKAIISLGEIYGLSSYFLLPDQNGFEKKLTKACHAYARCTPKEIPLIVADYTIFGSAKEGIVLTDQSIYINIAIFGQSTLAVADVDAVEVVKKMNDYIVCFKLNRTEYCVYTTEKENEAYNYKKFFQQALRIIGMFKENRLRESESVPEPAVYVKNTVEMQWLCACGKINKNRFCNICGRSRETGNPVWICECGNINKGKFCVKCGKPKTL